MFLFSIFSSQKRKFLFFSLLLVLTFLSFSPSLKSQFLNWGDDKYLTANVNVLTFDMPHLKALLKERINGLRIPLSSLSFYLEHHWGGLNPFIFHLDNLLLHLVCVILVFFFALNLGLEIPVAFLGTLIFAIHPTKVEAVAWVSSRKEVLYAVLYMASLVSYQKNHLRLSLLFYLLSLLANPMAISLPLIMILIDWFNNGSVKVRDFINKWIYFLITFLIGGWSYAVFLRFSLSHPFQAPLIWVWTFCFYIFKIFIPLVIAPIYVLPKPVSLFSLDYFLAIVIFTVILVSFWFARKNKWVVLGFVFYFLSIFFVIPLEAVKDNNIIADRFLYLPSLGFCLLSAVGVTKLHRFLLNQEAILRYLFSSAVVILIFGLMLLTFNQSLVWQNSKSLWQHQIKVLPHPFALNKLATTLTERNPSEKADIQAVGLYHRAIEIDSQYIQSYCNLAELYKREGRLEDAFIWYSKALTVNDKNREALLGLGLLYQQMNKPQEAIGVFKRLLEIYPDDESIYISIVDAYSKAIARFPQEKAYQEQREEVLSEYEDLSKRKKYTATDYYNLGFLYEQVGGYDEAIRFYKKALQINPIYQKALYNLAFRYQEMGDFKTALVLYQHLIHFYPKFAPGYLNMGIIYNTLGEVTQARMFYQKTIHIDPNNAGAFFNLGYLCEAGGDFKGALNYYEKAVDINPQLAEGYYNMGNVYAALGQIPEAIASYLKTVSINKNHQNAFVNLSILSFKSRDFTGAIKYLTEAQRLGYNPPEEYLKSLEPYRKTNK